MIPLSLLWFWPFWLRGAMLELKWHFKEGDDPHQPSPPQFLLACLPGLHVLYAYRLARMLKTIEEQDGATETSPMLAAYLSLVPPLCVVYLQTKLNGHWRRHLRP
jgi:hypothetical protein